MILAVGLWTGCGDDGGKDGVTGDTADILNPDGQGFDTSPFDADANPPLTGSVLCAPCDTDADCGGGGATCITYGGLGGYCGTPCGAGCPNGYRCETNQCVDVDGVCDCPAGAEGRTTWCIKQNAQGSCRGRRTCTNLGLSECDAPVPRAELCNGVDDNCDGTADENFTGLGGPCDGDDADQCPDGQNVCSGDGFGLVCTDDDSAPVERCNGFDDNCNGFPDEDWPELGNPCTNGDVCGPAVWACAANGLGVECKASGGPLPGESCNGLDDDCDGSIDEDWPTLGQPCDNGNTCAQGTWICAASGGIECSGTGGGATPTEACNNIDDDCDGAIDELWPELGQPCDSGNACAPGQWACGVGGLGLQCSGGGGTTPIEVCNGTDDDCDGNIDEGGVCQPSTPTVCYPGEFDTWDVCFDLVPKTGFADTGYNYPSSTDPRYAKPVNFLDLETAPATTKLAKNFRLDELMQAWKGRYGIFSAATMAHWQNVRTAIGVPLYINSGYRNVDYNASVGGVTFSRHMYGDAADVTAQGGVSLQTIANACTAEGAGFIQLYAAHVHCDWRNDPLGNDFWPAGPSAGPVLPTPSTLPGEGALPEGIWADVEVVTEAPTVGQPLRLEARWGPGFDEGAPWVGWIVTRAGHVVADVGPTETLTLTPDVAGDYDVQWTAGGLIHGGLVVTVTEAP